MILSLEEDLDVHNNSDLPLAGAILKHPDPGCSNRKSTNTKCPRQNNPKCSTTAKPQCLKNKAALVKLGKSIPGITKIPNPSRKRKYLITAQKTRGKCHPGIRTVIGQRPPAFPIPIGQTTLGTNSNQMKDLAEARMIDKETLIRIQATVEVNFIF